MVMTADLHPAARRRMEQRLPPAEQHDVALVPLGGGDGTCIIVTSDKTNVVPALFDDLKQPDWRDRLDQMRRVRGESLLELAQPIHGKFQLVLFEAVCKRPGNPRLDPEKIESAGVVVRRVRGAMRQGWTRNAERNEGWQTLPDTERDPDGEKAQQGHAGNRAIRRLIAQRQGADDTTSEAYEALFIAPPNVCNALGKTVLFAVLPVVSAEQSEVPSEPVDFLNLPAEEEAKLVAHLTKFFKRRRRQLGLPRAGETLSAGWNVTAVPSSEASPVTRRLYNFGRFLQQCAVELDMFGGSKEAASLQREFAKIDLPIALDEFGRTEETIDAASFIDQAIAILLDGQTNPSGLRMPLAWPQVSRPQSARLIRSALACLNAQHARLSNPEKKYENENSRYAVRGFMRVAGHVECPDQLIWSKESETFRILPWWDGDGTRPTIKLPDLADLKKATPTVSFAMPPTIANLLNSDPKKLLDGDGSENNSGIAWLCSFSLPYITICAFIVLNIFLQLFNLIFSWLLFIKVCIPMPNFGSSSDQGGSG